METLELLIISIIGCAVLAFITPYRKALFAIIVTICFLLTISAFVVYFNVGDPHFVLGNFHKTIGIEHSFTDVSRIMATIIIISGIYTLLVLLRRNSTRLKYSIGFTSIVIVCGLILVMTGDFFNFYVFLELMTICICLVFANTDSTHNKKCTLEYLLIGGVGAIFLVLAIEIIYIIFNTLNISIIAEYSDSFNVSEDSLLKVVVSLIILTSFLKIGIFPFTSWVRKIYTVCPRYFLPFYGSVISNIAIYTLLFFLYGALHRYSLIIFASHIITPFCVMGILLFSVTAIKERDLRVMMAYSTLAQVGYIYISLVTPNIHSIAGGIIHMMHNSLVKFGIFVFIVQLYNLRKSYSVSAIKGVGSNTLVGIAFCILAASLIGIPGTSGFISKFYMVQGLVESGKFFVLAIFTVGTVLNMVYIWRIISAMYFEKHPDSEVVFPALSQILIMIPAVVVVIFGVVTNYTLEIPQQIATNFLQSLN